jgi:hypothetical protein
MLGFHPRGAGATPAIRIYNKGEQSLLNEEFERCWQEAQHRLKAGLSLQELCKEADIYGVNLGAMMDLKQCQTIFEELKNDDT